jgi:hypothetical protein
MPTREEIRKVMQETRGSYVLLTPKGTFHIRTEADIPSDAELARGDPDQEARTRDDLQRQIRELQAQVRTLAPSSAPVPPEPTVNPDLGLKQGTEGVETTPDVPTAGGTTSDATEPKRSRRG